MKKYLTLILLFPLVSYGGNVKCLLPEGTYFEPLIPKGQMKSSYHFRVDTSKDVFLISDGVCINLSDADTPILAFPPSFVMDDISWMKNGDCLFSDSTSIYYNNKEYDSTLRLIETNMRSICYCSSDYGIYYYDKDSTNLFFFSYPKAESQKVCQFSKSIHAVSVSGDNLFVAYGGNVCMIKRNHEMTKLFKTSVLITSLAATTEGTLFYGTTDGLFYYDNEDRQFQVADISVKEIMIAADDLYIIFIDGSSARIRGISGYRRMVDSIITPRNSYIPSKHSKKENTKIIEARTLLQKHLIKDSETSYSNAICLEQVKRSVGTGVNGDILAEYAYVLALHHDFEAALMNIDRARMVGAKYGDFYAAQVLTLMGYTDAAQQLMRQAKVPDWINGDYQGLNEKYRTTASINRDAPEVALKRANKLAANKQTIQAMALFEELAAIYPDTYIIYVDYSTVWESLGYFAYAAQLLQKGIGLMPKEQNENKQIFMNHLSKVNEQKAHFENASWLKRTLGMNPPKLMTYVGASVAKNMYSLNGRMGVYTSNKFSASLNVGLNYANEKFYGSIGVSGYKTWGIFVGGLGITDMFGKDSNTFSLTPSVGLSFLNKKQNSSFDIMVNGYIPFSSEQKFSYSISIGKTIYFDLNGLLK